MELIIGFSVIGLYMAVVGYGCWKNRNNSNQVPPTYTPPSSSSQSSKMGHEYDRMVQEQLLRDIRDNTKK